MSSRETSRRGAALTAAAAMALVAAVVLAVAPCVLAADALDESFATIDELKRGDRCVGLTVFNGVEIEEFELEILGVVRGSAPGTDLIIGRAEGAILEETGILEGMSGSPVYKDGRLIGAVASTWQFTKRPIAGITPIAEMLPALDLLEGDGHASAPSSAGSAIELIPAKERERSAVARICESVGVPVLGNANLHAAAPVQFGDRSLTPIAAPLVVTGASEDFLHAASRVLGGGMTPLLGSSVSSVPTASSSRSAGADSPEAGSLQPGSAVGVQFVRGDANWTAVGTVTHRDGDRIVAFGHPLFNSGPLEMPMVTARVHALMPLQSISFKYASGGRMLGTMKQDRNRAVAGVVGPEPRMVPVSAGVRTQDSEERRFDFDVVVGRPYTAIFSGLALGGAVSSAAMTSGPATVEIAARIEADGDTVEYRDLFHTSEPSMRCAGEVSLLLSVLNENPFRDIEIGSIDLDVRIREGDLWTAIERVEADRKVYRPGDVIELLVSMRPRRGEPFERELSLRIPGSTPDGPLTVRVGDATSFHLWEQDRLGFGGAPRSYEQLLDLIERSKPGNAVVAQLLSEAPGFSLSGEEMRGIPGRAGLAMASGATSGAVDETALSVLSQAELTIDDQAMGFHELTIHVRQGR